jgi:hypothetical protein
MAKKKNSESPASEIEKYFDSLPKKIFNSPELLKEFINNRERWQLKSSFRIENLIDFLLNESRLEKIELHSEHYQNVCRYSWGTPSIYALALSIKSNSFLTHGTAAFLHKLTDESPQIIYVNYEQTPKPQYGNLSQDGIHRAFSKQQRQTKLVYTFEDNSIVVINGKNTGQIGLCTFADDNGHNPLIVTDLERTLIDITVRPAYAGSAMDVLEAYERARYEVDIRKLLKTLKTMNYLYPYHQAIGFFMEKAGYPKKSWSKLLELGTEYDFYTTHQLPENRQYDSKWRIYYPEELD